MHLKTPTYFHLFILFVFSVSVGILAAPLNTAHSPSSHNLATTIKRGSSESGVKDNPSVAGNVQNESPFKFPENGKLVLRKKDGGPETEYTLLSSKMIGKGAYGEVYPAGKDGEQQQLVAKRFKRIEVEGLDETDNLRAVGDLYDSGFDNYAENSRYWAIMPRKDGEILNKMDDFWEMIDQEGDCGAFMEKARDAVIEESRRLFKLPAAPMHDDIRQENVLFWKDPGGKWHANFVDMGRIRKMKGEKELADDKEIEGWLKTQKEELEEGYKLKPGQRWPNLENQKPDLYDFSNRNNCGPDEEDSEEIDSE